MLTPTYRLGIFAKYWQAGAVKTRLAQSIGAESAAALHRLFLRTLLRRFATTPVSRVLAITPPDHRSAFEALAGGDWQIESQSNGDLGQRMAAYFRSAFKQGCERVLLIGSDSPTLPAASITHAFEQLASHPVVLGPSADGGYYLVGASRTVPPIFDDVAWSTSGVWEETIRRLDAARVPFAQLPPWYDVDNVEDLRRLSAELERDADENLLELAAAVSAALGTRR